MATRFPSIRPFRWPIGLAVAAALLVAVPIAAAAPSPPDVDSRPRGPTNNRSATFSWDAATPDDGYSIVRYEGGLNGASANLGAAAGSTTVDLPGEGTYTFQVRAVQASVADPTIEEAGRYGSATLVVDRTDPRIRVDLVPASPNGTNGWYRNATSEGGSRLVVNWTCTDSGGAGIESCPADETVGTQGAGQTRTGRAEDAAGNTSGQRTTPSFNYDGLNPNTGPMRAPSPGAIVASEPTFLWGPAVGSETSGFNRYEILVRIGSTYRVVARVAHHAGTTQYSATRDPSLWAQAFPKDTDLRWYVRTYDNAGNSGGSSSQSRSFRIDSTVPAPPTITGGPSGPTNVSGPTFSWTGSQPSYAWDVSAAGTETVVVSGSGPQTQAALPPLPDGDYTFGVSQVTAFGARGAEASSSFQIDTVAPPAPVVTGRPPFPTSSATPSFSWTTEAGAYSRWRVIGAGGGTLQGSDTPLNSVAVGPFASGAYNFRVAQVDPAGNESAPALEPFSIISAARPAARRPLALPRQHAGRLRPRAGSLVLTRRPLLRWNGGPTGTTIFNLQVFRVRRANSSTRLTPAVKKIFSVFPKRRVYRMPAAKILPGTCYVWRVWPFVGDRFTKTPLGVSNFCVASAKRLRQKASVVRQRARAG